MNHLSGVVMKKILFSGLVAGFVMLVVSMIISMLFGVVFPSIQAEYSTAGLFRPWSDPLMSLYFAYPFVLGLILAWIWDKTKGLLREKVFWKNAVAFAFAYWVVASIPGMFITYSSFPISILMLLSWTIGGLVQAVCAGLVYSKMNA